MLSHPSSIILLNSPLNLFAYPLIIGPIETLDNSKLFLKNKYFIDLDKYYKAYNPIMGCKKLELYEL